MIQYRMHALAIVDAYIKSVALGPLASVCVLRSSVQRNVFGGLMSWTVRSPQVAGGKPPGRPVMFSRMTSVGPVVMLAIACFVSLACCGAQASNITADHHLERTQRAVNRSNKAVRLLPGLTFSIDNGHLGRRSRGKYVPPISRRQDNYVNNQNIWKHSGKFSRNMTKAIENNDRSLQKQQNDHTFDEVQEKLHAGIIFRNNLINMFGFILCKANDGLRFHHYTSLKLIHNALRNRQVNMFNMLPILNRLQGKTNTEQFMLIIRKLAKNMPGYLQGACKFWVEEIRQGRVNIEHILSYSSKHLNLLAGLQADVVKICRTTVKAEEMFPYDLSSRVTADHLGLVFVKIFNQLQNKKIRLSQRLFGLILANFPTIEFNPVFEEESKFICSITERNLIPEWSRITAEHVAFEDPYTLVDTVIGRILSSKNTPRAIKDALRIINMEIMRMVTFPFRQKCEVMSDLSVPIDWDLLLKPLQMPEFSCEVIQLKDELLIYLQSGHGTINISEDNREFVYRNPIDLLIAALVRLQRKIPDSHEDVRKTCAALLSALILKRNSCIPALPGSVKIDFLRILTFFQNPNADSELSNVVDELRHKLTYNPNVLFILNEIISRDKSKCINPRQCMHTILIEIEKVKNIIPVDIYKNLQVLLMLDRYTHESCPAKYQSTLPPTSITERPTPGTYTPHVPHWPLTESTTEQTSTESSTWPPEESSETTVTEVSTTTVRPTVTTIHVPKPTPTKPSGGISIDVRKIPIIYPIRLCIINDVPFIFNINVSISITKKDVITLPSIEDLVKPPNPADVPKMLKMMFSIDLIKTLQVVYGQDFVPIIVGPDFDMKKCSTNACLILEILRKVSRNPKITAHEKLMDEIKLSIRGIDYVSTIVLIHAVAAYEDIRGNTIYISFNTRSRDRVIIGDKLPETIPPNYITIAIIHSSYLALPVDPDNPYNNLMPELPKGSALEVLQRPLKLLLQSEQIIKILGANFEHSAFPNKGALLIGVLHKLLASPEIQQDRKLLATVKMYLLGIRQFATSRHIPVQYLEDVVQQMYSKGRIDLTILIKALPPAENEAELDMLQLLSVLLSQKDLLKVLKIPPPPVTTTRGHLLKTIIDTALTRLDTNHELTMALRYYQDRVIMTGYGALPILFVYEMTVRMRVELGEIIVNVINYDNLPHDGKLAYNDLMKYFNDNPKIFEDKGAFAFEEYQTEGAMLKAFLEYLRDRNDIDDSAKMNITYLLPYVQLDGPGMKPMPIPTVEHHGHRRKLKSQSRAKPRLHYV